MTALAIVSDVEAGLGRSLTTDEIPRATALLALASAHVEAETGYRFAPGAYTVGRRTRDGKVILPGTVATIAAVRSLDQDTGAVATLALTTDYTTHGRTLYGLRVAFVEVDFTVTEPVPEVISQLVAGIVASTLSGPPVGAASEGAGPFSISYVNSSGKVWLSASDKAILGRYKQLKPALDLL